MTLIELERIQTFAKASGLALALHALRRNPVTSGIDLNVLRARRFFVGDAELEGLALCKSCSTFARRTHAVVLKLFLHKGGLRARTAQVGTVRIADAIKPGGRASKLGNEKRG